MTNYRSNAPLEPLLIDELKEVKERRKEVLQGVWKRRAQIRERMRRKYASFSRLRGAEPRD